MKLNSKYLLLSLLVFFLLSSTTVVSEESQTSSTSDAFKATNTHDPSLSYTIHPPIEIASDSDFTSANGVVSGSGNWNEPFIIEGWEIITLTGSGIFIHDTTVYFVIRDCYIDAGIGGTYPASDSAIFLNNTADGRGLIEGNTCIDSKVGILMCYTGSNNITNNLCDGNDYGVNLHFANVHTVTNNEITNSRYAIHLWESSNCDLENNICDLSSEINIFVATNLGTPTYNNIINNILSNRGYF